MVIAQDQATSVVWGMPGAVPQAGFAAEVVPLSRVAEAIIRLLPTHRSAANSAAAARTGATVGIGGTR